MLVSGVNNDELDSNSKRDRQILKCVNAAVLACECACVCACVGGGGGMF